MRDTHTLKEKQPVDRQVTHAHTHDRDTRYTEYNTDRLDMPYGPAANDARYQRNSTKSYISLKEARGIIPEFNGTPH
ncbi:dna replication and repair protein recf [Lasius niger]|uniref:Dna replication and repair protein recf n=1 Tax=Lasius niger TaxID=67767 RepID=A0A0J7KQC9_LASNI|nr:dna replication and repair protein recf [Lasius niger]